MAIARLGAEVAREDLNCQYPIVGGEDRSRLVTIGDGEVAEHRAGRD